MNKAKQRPKNLTRKQLCYYFLYRTILNNKCLQILPEVRKPNARGYYVILFEGKSQYVHRLICYEKYGESFMKDKVTRHTCDNVRCINPEHLIYGSQKDNVRDIKSRRIRINQLQKEIIRLNKIINNQMCTICTRRLTP